MPAATIRTARPEDLEAVRAVFREASLSNEGDRAVLRAHPEVLVFDGAALAEGRTRVAVTGGGPESDTVVGFATVALLDGGLELEDLFVDPRWMRRGVATALVEDLLATARVTGVATVRVTANDHAAAFYASVGFVPDGRVTTRFGPVPTVRSGRTETSGRRSVSVLNGPYVPVRACPGTWPLAIRCSDAVR
jgi:GNAT superfamily N-acetyltransferase